MANEELVALLKQGAQAWNAWRAEHREAAVDLSGAALRGLDLTRADLAGADLIPTALVPAPESRGPADAGGVPP